MNKPIIILFSAFFALFLTSPVNAQEIRATWQTKKALVINTHGYGGAELEAVKQRLVLGPSEWYVKYERQISGSNYTPVYEETWRLPTLPDCYRPVGRPACLPNGALVKNYLWGIASSFSGYIDDPEQWTFEEVDPSTASLYANISNKVRGPAVIGGKNSDNIHNLLPTGAYGWSHGMFSNSNRGAIVWAGAMVPLKWEVTGINYED